MFNNFEKKTFFQLGAETQTRYCIFLIPKQYFSLRLDQIKITLLYPLDFARILILILPILFLSSLNFTFNLV